MDNVRIPAEPAAEEKGRCHKTGLSIVPQLHTCPSWVERTYWKGGDE